MKNFKITIKKINSIIHKNKIITLLLLTNFFVLCSGLIWRSAMADETIYLRDTVIIYKALKSGENPFQYNVGLHGVFFKVPISLIYFITGPSIYVATLSNVLLGIVSLALLYFLVKKHIFQDPWALYTVALLAFSYRFYGAGTTFLREMPVLFSFILFLYFLLEKKSKLLIGFSLLVILDAKEHVFFTTAPPYILILLVENWQKKDRKIFYRIKEFIIDIFLAFSPSLIYIILMFTTNIIPVNIFLAYIIGLVDTNIKSLAVSFSINQATANLIETPSVKTMPAIQKTNVPYVTTWVYITNIFLSYLGKVLYPRTLSFLSVPKIIAVPAISMSLIKFKKTWKGKNLKNYTYLIIFLWFYLLVYILRSSHGRYLFTISPIFFIYFVLFLKEGVKNRRFAFITTAVTGIFIMGGLYFEHNYILLKTGMNIFLFTILLILVSQKKMRGVTMHTLRVLMVFVICIFTLGTSLISSATIGQIYLYSNWGKHLETERIMSNFDKNEIIWINPINKWRQLPAYFREDVGHVNETRYVLKDNIPSKYLLKEPKLKTHSFYWDDLENFKYAIFQEKITTVALVTSTTEEKFAMEEKLDELMFASWLDIKETISMKNKKLYIFKVKDRIGIQE